MIYLVTFLEGIITFISPCLLPMLPIYVSYFAGQSDNEGDKKRGVFVNALAFVLGFTAVFVTLGALAGTLGSALNKYSTIVNILLGLLMIVLGLSIMGLFNIPALSFGKGFGMSEGKKGFFKTLVFGIIFSISWTPCVGAFLGAALMQAASGASSLKGIFMLLSYSIGLGIPFIISAILIDKLKNAFNFFKKHHKIISIISGGLLIVFGILMATGLLGKFLGLLSI